MIGILFLSAIASKSSKCSFEKTLPEKTQLMHEIVINAKSQITAWITDIIYNDCSSL